MQRVGITQAGLFRMSFILQDSSATTTSTYLLKIIESVLYTANDYLSIPEINDMIQNDLSLEFSDLEILNAVNGNNSHIIEREKKYALTPQRQNVLSSIETVETKLNHLVRLFIQSSGDTSFSEESFTDLFSRFLYHCFNANKEALLMIIDDKEKSTDRARFDASQEECDVINRFLAWENPDKDKLIYQVISTCYAYCSLTVKKIPCYRKEFFKARSSFLMQI